MNTTVQKIRPGLLFTLPARGRSYRVLRANGAEYWTCIITATRNANLVGFPQSISGREIQDAMSKGE